jgi:hypothetical protein
MSTLRVETTSSAAVEPLAVRAQQLGRLLGLSKRTIHRRDIRQITLCRGASYSRSPARRFLASNRLGTGSFGLL